MKNTILKIVAIVTLGLIVYDAQAQYTYRNISTGQRYFKYRWRLLQRMDIGFHAGFGKAGWDRFMIVQRSYMDGSETVYYNTSYNDQFRILQSSYGGNIGFYLPVGRVARKTQFAINAEVYFSSLSYKLQDFNLYGLSADFPTISGMSVMVPLGFDLKWGAQATMSKHSLGSTAIGFGIAPTYTSFDNLDVDQNGDAITDMYVQPYIKAEFGFYTGIFWKVKGMILFNRIKDFVWDTNNRESIALTEAYIHQEMWHSNISYTLGLSFNIGSMKWRSDW